MDSIEAVFEEQGLIEKVAEHQHYLVGIDGHARAWMKHQKVLIIVTPNPARKSDKAWLIKGYESWGIYLDVNWPFTNPNKLMECLRTHRLLASLL